MTFGRRSHFELKSAALVDVMEYDRQCGYLNGQWGIRGIKKSQLLILCSESPRERVAVAGGFFPPRAL
jgi:hypothetical protein